MTDYEREMLVILAEECAELQKEICKALRHGLAASDPTKGAISNRQRIEQEAGDVQALIDILIGNLTLSAQNVRQSRNSKPQRMKPYVHGRGSERCVAFREMDL